MRLGDVLARLEGVRPCNGYFIARCPAHLDRNASLSVRETEGGKLLINCFVGCEYSEVMRALGCRPRGSTLIPRVATRLPATALSEAERTRFAMHVWQNARSARGTIVETYLRTRHIRLPTPISLRFHANLKHPSGAFLPAMVAAVQSADGTIIAIHRTYLRGDGSGKADVQPQKAMLGPCAGGAVRFAKPCETIAIAEGIETALSVAQCCPSIAVWAALSTSGMRALKLPAEVQEIILLADGDQPGEAAARVAALRLIREGRKARIARPGAGRDFNELLSGELEL
jgi:putative DNA primase/helicase